MTTSTFRRSSSRHADVYVASSTRADGDFHPHGVEGDVLERRRRRIADVPWAWLDHVHGTKVVRFDDVADCVDRGGAVGDAALTNASGLALSVWVADCAPIVMIGIERELGVVHAGWRGLAGGIIDEALAATTEPIERVILGPVIGPCCYEFGADDAATVAMGCHAETEQIVHREHRARGAKVALDVPTAVRIAFEQHGIGVERHGGCTGCSGDYFSHRVRNDRERHVMTVWQGER